MERGPSLAIGHDIRVTTCVILKGDVRTERSVARDRALAESVKIEGSEQTGIPNAVQHEDLPIRKPRHARPAGEVLMNPDEVIDEWLGTISASEYGRWKVTLVEHERIPLGSEYEGVGQQLRGNDPCPGLMSVSGFSTKVQARKGFCAAYPAPSKPAAV